MIKECLYCKDEFNSIRINHNYCNMGIGLLKDDIKSLNNAIKYLKENN